MAAPALSDRAWLTLGQLEAYDPGAPHKRGERRFCCPLPACSEKSIESKHRSLSLDQHTGAWSCHRCGGAGQLEDYRTRERNPHAARAKRLHTRMWGTPPAPTRAPIGPAPAVSVVEAASSASGEGLPPAVRYARCRALADTPGAAYLASRGIDVEIADQAGVRYQRLRDGWPPMVRPAVLFPVKDAAGDVVALQARYLAVDGDQLKTKSHGSISAGVFATPGALASPMVAICEAPIDALSLAGCGLPALALCGSDNRPIWLRTALARQRVYIATDADKAGEAAAANLADWFCFGPRPARLTPGPCKDWNEALTEYERLYREMCATHDRVLALHAAGDLPGLTAARVDLDVAKDAYLAGGEIVGCVLAVAHELERGQAATIAPPSEPESASSPPYSPRGTAASE